MIKNIVFDIGGVLADLRIKEFLAEKGLDAPTIRRVLKASVMNPYWGRFERGEVSEEETLRAFAAADPGIESELRLAYTDLSGMLVMRGYAIPLVQALKRAGCTYIHHGEEHTAVHCTRRTARRADSQYLQEAGYPLPWPLDAEDQTLLSRL